MVALHAFDFARDDVSTRQCRVSVSSLDVHNRALTPDQKALASRRANDKGIWQAQDMTIADLAAHIAGGGSIANVYRTGTKRKANWSGTQVMTVDVDSGLANMQDILNHPLARKYACIVGHSTSSTPDVPKLHVHFVLSDVCTDRDVATRANQILLEQFAAFAPDRASVDHDSRYFLGCKDAVLSSGDTLITIDDILALADANITLFDANRAADGNGQPQDVPSPDDDEQIIDPSPVQGQGDVVAAPERVQIVRLDDDDMRDVADTYMRMVSKYQSRNTALYNLTLSLRVQHWSIEQVQDALLDVFIACKPVNSHVNETSAQRLDEFNRTVASAFKAKLRDVSLPDTLREAMLNVQVETESGQVRSCKLMTSAAMLLDFLIAHEPDACGCVVTKQWLEDLGLSKRTISNAVDASYDDVAIFARVSYDDVVSALRASASAKLVDDEQKDKSRFVRKYKVDQNTQNQDKHLQERESEKKDVVLWTKCDFSQTTKPQACYRIPEIDELIALFAVVKSSSSLLPDDAFASVTKYRKAILVAQVKKLDDSNAKIMPASAKLGAACGVSDRTMRRYVRDETLSITSTLQYVQDKDITELNAHELPNQHDKDAQIAGFLLADNGHKYQASQQHAMMLLDAGHSIRLIRYAASHRTLRDTVPARVKDASNLSAMRPNKPTPKGD